MDQKSNQILTGETKLPTKRELPLNWRVVFGQTVFNLLRQCSKIDVTRAPERGAGVRADDGMSTGDPQTGGVCDNSTRGKPCRWQQPGMGLLLTPALCMCSQAAPVCALQLCSHSKAGHRLSAYGRVEVPGSCPTFTTGTQQDHLREAGTGGNGVGTLSPTGRSS